MKFIIQVLPLTLIFLILSCNTKDVDYNDTIEVYEQFSELQSKMDNEGDKLLVVNFWATSCPPCIKEMPHFNQLEKEYSNEEVKIFLVSLDDIDRLDTRVYAFVEKYNIAPEVALLGDQNYSAWTDHIDSSWYGALPATILIKGDERKFKFGIYESYKELQTDVEEVLIE